ncbi:hypothetical protein LCGC14_0576890 [marine sediment metagenome]|uniref:Uncharacterized protein n=1 Tax=marine sediment metagenome TaxID=412755 RepID=A0A0F9S118_9ZZZZ
MDKLDVNTIMEDFGGSSCDVNKCVEISLKIISLIQENHASNIECDLILLLVKDYNNYKLINSLIKKRKDENG